MTRRRNRTMVPAAATPMTTAETTTSTTPAENSTTSAPADEAADGADAAIDDRVRAVKDTEAAGNDDPQLATPTNWEQCNEVWCDLDRLGKATIAAAITAGRELATAKRELGDSFLNFAALRTPWQAPEAGAVIRFAAQAGLQPEQLSPAIAVPLSRVLATIALLGRLSVEQED